VTYSETRSRLCSRIFASLRGHPESLTPVVQKHGNQKSELFCLAVIVVMAGKFRIAQERYHNKRERSKVDWSTKQNSFVIIDTIIISGHGQSATQEKKCHRLTLNWTTASLCAHYTHKDQSAHTRRITLRNNNFHILAVM
jgi:hypothetical protein